MKSKFRLHFVFNNLSSLITYGVLFYSIVRKLRATPANDLKFIFAFMLLVLLFTFLLTLHDTLKKAVVVYFEGDTVALRPVYGLWFSKQFRLKEFDGYIIASHTSWRGTYEELYFMKNDKKAIRLSMHFHKNYHDLKQYLAPRMPLLGNVPISTSAEIKDVFLG